MSATRFVTRRQAAQYAAVEPATVTDWVRRGLLAPYWTDPVTKSHFYRLADVLRVEREQRHRRTRAVA